MVHCDSPVMRVMSMSLVRLQKSWFPPKKRHLFFFKSNHLVTTDVLNFKIFYLDFV